MPEERKVEIVYNRWVLIIPIIMIVIGGVLIFFFWSLNPFLGLLGGALILVGIMVFGILLVLVIALHLSARSLKRERPTPPPLSEEFEKTE
ncbi:MAG: hypothetical protein ACXADB_04280 [Candidatus Hermodarchaeia archaeon]|jgi:amino acid transporter